MGQEVNAEKRQDINVGRAQYIKMTETPVEKLVAKLAVPTVISMMVTNVYNLVDTAFVGMLGNSASGAVGIVFGYMAILQAVGFLCGQGAGSIMSRSLGNKDVERATRFTSTGFFMSLLLGAVIGGVSFLCLDPLVYGLGSTVTIAPYAKTYITWIILAAPFLTASLTLNNLLRYEGRAQLGMVGLMTGAVLNIGGDAVLIFGCKMGIAGAGISTAVSQTISFLILLWMFLSGKTQTRIRIACVDVHIKTVGDIIATGFPSLLRQALNSVATIVLNSNASLYGDAAVAAMSIVSRVSFFMMAIAIGIGQGFQPVSSFNYGAGKFDRVKRAYWFTFGLAEILLVLIVIPVFIWAEPVVRVFRNDAEVVSYAVRALRLHGAALILVPITMVTEMGFQSTGQRVLATVASSLRSGVIFIPTLVILAHVRGMAGIQEAQPLAFVLSFFVFLILSGVFLRQIGHAAEVVGTTAIAYAGIIGRLKEPVIITDTAYRFVEANARALEVFPTLQKQKRGEPIDDELLRDAFQDHKDGEIIADDYVMRVDVQKILSEGEVQGYAMLLFDLTKERIQLEQMRRLKVEADLANQAKSDFLAKMSHEIRTPINAILGMDEMILRENRDADVRRYALDIRSAANSLLSIINEILDSSKIESGKMEIVPTDYELGNMLTDLHNMISGRAAEKDLNLLFEVDESLPAAYYGDDVRIKQVLLNILNNAVKYTRDGGVTLTLSGSPDEEDPEYEILHFAVKDTGIGIREEDIKLLFSEYVRIDMDRNRYIEGTGLGISISRQLLQMMGSSLQVKSTYGKGSVFYFDLRQKIVKREPLGDYSYKGERFLTRDYHAAVYEAPDARVLLVDDNDMNRKVFKNLLRQTKMHIADVASGKECLELVQRERFDLIFMDHMMPVMDGIETFHAMRLGKNLCQNTPVIMLTANAVKGAKEQYIREGFQDFLSKPIMPDKLDEVILKYLPAELVQMLATEEAVSSDVEELAKAAEDGEVKVDLPELDEFDYEYAMGLLRNKALLKETLIDFYRAIPGIEQELSLYEDSIELEESLNAYRIQVHALKSTAATVGALLLSKLARILEVAAREGETGKIRTLHPILLEELEKHRKRLEILVPRDEKKDIRRMEEVMPLFVMLQQSVEKGDFKTSDYLMQKIKEYAYPKTLQALVEQLDEQILELEDEAALATIKQITEGGDMEA
ncbi:MAG: MATE family efflux transporter [Lachnospiraceae bacterium]|nr:MATE family efflux transporter [Lachnospiraceae bacterium]